MPNGRALRDDFEEKLLRFFYQASAESRTLNYALLSRNRELEEQRKITTTAIPYLGVTGVVLTVFMIITLFDVPFYKSQHIEVVWQQKHIRRPCCRLSLPSSLRGWHW